MVLSAMSFMFTLKHSPKKIATSKRFVPARLTSKSRQMGASIMELMVGITIGLLVVLAALGSLVYTQVSSTTMVDATRLQQKADAAFRIISFQTLRAGALELNTNSSSIDPGTVTLSTDYTGFNPNVINLPTVVASVHGVNGIGTTQDILRISYQDNGSTTTLSTVRDCLGQSTAVATRGIRVDNTFTYQPAVGGGGDLQCQGAAAGATLQPILDGVEDFQVTYGVRTVVAGVENFQYFTANNVTDWSNIQTVNICLQLRGDTRGNPRPGWTTANRIPACGTVLDTNDGFLRRVYRRTFSIRNALL
jgi:type IV pilus assembly protein PilW